MGCMASALPSGRPGPRGRAQATPSNQRAQARQRASNRTPGLAVFAGVLVSWFDLMSVFNLGSSWIWKNVVAHVLGGVFPGTWMFEMNPTMLQTRTDAALDHMAVLKGMYSVMATPQLWVGVVAGIAMIIAAIRLRRWRDEG